MTRKPAPKKIPFKDVQIDVWAPTLPDQPYLAMYKGLPMVFRAKTQKEVVAAESWREEELEKELNRNRNAEKASQRMKRYHEKKKLESTA